MTMQLTPASGGSFAINFFQACFGAQELAVFAGSYGDDARFEQLVAAQDGWTAWRDSDDGARVYVYQHDSATTFARAGFRPVTVALSESPPLFCHALLDGLDRHLHQLGFARLGRNGYANWSTGNLLHGLEIPRFSPDPRVGLYPKILVSSFVTRFDTIEPLIGIIVDVAHTTRLDIPVDELLRNGFDVHGYYVKLRPDSGGPTRHEGLMIGRIHRVEGDELVLQDVRDPTLDRIHAACCLLRPDRRTLNDYLRWQHPGQYRAVSAALLRKVAHLHAPREKLRLMEAFVARRLIGGDGAPVPIAAGLTVSFAPAAAPSADKAAFRAVDLLAPTYSFDPESPKTHSMADNGLKQYGPYSQARLRGRKLRILALAPESFKGNVEQFVSAFQTGLQGFERTYNGFRFKYRLDGLQVSERYFPWRGTPAKDAYYNAAVQALQERSDYDLCFIIIQDDFKNLAPANDPYFICKALLLSFGIPVQAMRIETLRQPAQSLQWSINTMALASYAKIGGTPFVLRSRQIRYHELVIGVGRSIERAPGSQLGAAKQIIGFATVFRSDGDYLLNACTPYADFANYERRLEEVILRSVGEVAASEGMADGDMVRLIFHVYKRTGRREVQAIQNAIGKLTRYTVEFALLHVNDSHDFKLFDRTNPGTRDRSGRVDEATAFVPPRQIMVEIGPRERLINFIGPEQYRRRGTPRPLRLTLDRASTFTDLNYLAQQAYEFSCMSWRTFNPSTQPITVLYPERIARLNSRLGQVAAWNQEIVRLKLQRTLWFI